MCPIKRKAKSLIKQPTSTTSITLLQSLKSEVETA